MNQLKRNELMTKCWLGKVKNIFTIREYDIIEYEDKRTGNLMYHPFVNDVDLHHSYSSLECALVGAIALRFDGPNSQAAQYFFKMIEI